MDHTLEITLSDGPVWVDPDLWPVAAEARGHTPWRNSGTPEHPSEHDYYRLAVRRHADGRALVYGVVAAADAAWKKPAAGVDRREGELLPPGADIPEAIRRVARLAGIPGEVVRACIADLPPREL